MIIIKKLNLKANVQLLIKAAALQISFGQIKVKVLINVIKNKLINKNPLKIAII